MMDFKERYDKAQSGDTAAKRLNARKLSSGLEALAKRYDGIADEELVEWRKERGVE